MNSTGEVAENGGENEGGGIRGGRIPYREEKRQQRTRKRKKRHPIENRERESESFSSLKKGDERERGLEDILE